MPFSREVFNQARFRRDIVGIDKKVPLYGGGYKTCVNLDNAASTPVLGPVLEKVNEFMDWYSSVHRGAGFKSQVSTRVYDEAHEIVGEFVKADLRKNSIIFVKNSTEAVNKVSYRMGLTKDDVILTTMMEHHSNDLPWRSRAKPVYAALDEKGALNYDDLEAKLRQYGDSIKLVSVSGASNVTGYKNDLGRIAALAHRAGVPVLVDGAQLIPHSPLDIKPDGHPEHIDYLVFSAHKMYAPFGTGVLIGPKHAFLRGGPEYTGGGTISIVTRELVEWAGLPDREEAGTPNVVGAVALAAAVKYLEGHGMGNIENHERALTSYALKKLAQIKGITIYGEKNPDNTENRVGVITFNLEGVTHELTAAALAWEDGIAVRNGCFCAHPYVLHLLRLKPQHVARIIHKKRTGDLSGIPGMVRVSLAAYNNKNDIDRLVECLGRITDMARSGELAERYAFSRKTGAYYPRNIKVDPGEVFRLG
ncbi:MAG: aminotransferase class V-fold PLP-dependent enzyme [Clostridia bacterium]|nr:aminotransferase class V-fold PLP-dependent enzyme [Clostridiales bacterium]